MLKKLWMLAMSALGKICGIWKQKTSIFESFPILLKNLGTLSDFDKRDKDLCCYLSRDRELHLFPQLSQIK